ncbi:MAG: hypothetical protein P1U36_00930 [Legionellaceae bacterium]|nr:hypothetical protein [Legionellaceae bacterium]
MPITYETHDKALVELTMAWKALPWYQRLFFPRALGRQLSEYDVNPSATTSRAAYEAYHNTWSIQRWIFSDLKVFSQALFPGLLNMLYDKGYLSDEKEKQTLDAVFAVKEGKQGEDLQAYSRVLLPFSMKYDIASTLLMLRGIEPADYFNSNGRCSDLTYLLSEGVLETYYLDVQLSHCPHQFTNGIVLLNRNGLLSGAEKQKNRDLYLELISNDFKRQSRSPSEQSYEDTVKALITLHKAHLLGEETRVFTDAVMKSARLFQTQDTASILCELYSMGLFNEINKTRLIKRLKEPDASLHPLAHVLNNIRTLKDLKLLTSTKGDAYLEAVITRSANYTALPKLFDLLKKHDLCTKDNIDWILDFAERSGERSEGTYHNLGQLHELLEVIEALGLLKQNNLTKIMKHPDINGLTSLIINAGPRYFKAILPDEHAQTKFEQAITCPYPRGGATALSWVTYAHLPRRGEGAHDYYQELIVEHADILLAEPELWENFPYQALTTECYNEIIRIAQEHKDNPEEGREVFDTYLSTIRREYNQDYDEADGNTQGHINHAQSTHTASVHETVSESLIELIKHYPSVIEEPQVTKHIDALTADIIALQTNLKPEDKNNPDMLREISAAIRFLKDLKQKNYYYPVEDKISNLSIKQVLALGWIAIHDDVRREGSLEDAKKHFVKGLYEAQRGYNFSHTGVDRTEQNDSTICAGGIINKIIEKLWGIHKDVSISYITLETFKNKIIPVLQEETDRFLAQDSFSLMSEIAESKPSDDEVSESIWNAIQSQVETRLFEEFGALFTGDKTNAQFQVILDDWRKHFDFIERLPQEKASDISVTEISSTFFDNEEGGAEESKTAGLSDDSEENMKHER